MEITQKIKLLPKKPGVYLFKNKNEEVLYIGKAKVLKNRVNSYFLKNGGHTGKTRVMVKHIVNVDFIVVETELDALLLENNLIKKYQPRYNVMLKDDKTYPWICIKNERFPRVISTRKKIEDGSQYFGPYASVKMMRAVLNLVNSMYKIRTCKYDLSEKNIERQKYRVCLEYHIGNCLGPCAGHQSEESYNDQIEDIKQILKGNIAGLIRLLKKRMAHYAEKLEFESAQFLKDNIKALEKYQSKSAVVHSSLPNTDVFTTASDINTTYVNFMRVVDGGVIQSHTMTFKKKLEEPEATMIERGMGEVAELFEGLSKNILVSAMPDVEFPGTTIAVPQIGDKKKLLDLSERNARYYMLDKQKQTKFADPERHAKRIMEQMKRDLRLKELPTHIECFDNSNLQGTHPVSACVVFKNGKPSKKDYRHFNIKTVEGPDDFASMKEAMHRRYGRLIREGEPLPQLIILDGGKGQLSAGVESLEELGLLGKVAIIGIAKKLEEIYYPGDSLPLYIDKKSETLKVIQFARNEAHRFGITHHRNRRSKASIKTELDNIPGIGKKTIEDLLFQFKSVSGVKNATLKELTNAVGRSRAMKLAKWFSEN